ncbi:hypothetical protein ACVOMV_36685 [Mesorhizobium atlanticum]
MLLELAHDEERAVATEIARRRRLSGYLAVAPHLRQDAVAVQCCLDRRRRQVEAMLIAITEQEFTRREQMHRAAAPLAARAVPRTIGCEMQSVGREGASMLDRPLALALHLQRQTRRSPASRRLPSVASWPWSQQPS